MAWAAVLLIGLSPARIFAEDPSLDEILAGFEDDPAPLAEPDPEAESDSGFERYLDLTGSVSVGASYNVKEHTSSIGPGTPPGPGTDYSGIQRLRARLDLQADAYLPRDWKGRIQAYVFYDFAYLIHGEDLYTRDVINDYEFESEILDFWVEGSVTDWLDLKLGRQVVNWGRSDTLRVTDIWNALNNREPGLVDIEELRLPSTMARADAYLGQWQFTALVVPEIRYDYNPPPGSDFFPVPRSTDLPDPPPGAPPGTREDTLQQLFAVPGLSNQAAQWGATPEYGAALTGIFSGWDISLYAARIYENQTSTVVGISDPSLASAYRIDNGHDLITMLGAGANYTRGAWLLKAEFAFLDDLDYSFLRPNPGYAPEAFHPTPPYLPTSIRLSRIDWMAGIEYYGFGDTNLSIDVAHRHVLDYDPLLEYFPNYVYEDSVEAALRVSSEFFNSRLRANGVGILLANGAGLQGGIIRVWADYEVAEALVLSGGYLAFLGEKQVPFNTWHDNDRIFAKLKYSFP
jgi:hypothetical protein